MKVNVQAWGAGFDDLADQIFHMLSEIQGRNYFRSHGQATWKPRVNVYETRNAYLVCVELAGVDPSRIDLRADTDGMYLRGTRDKPDPSVPLDDASDSPPIHSVHLMEIDWGRFERRLPLPADADAERASAVYRQGYLWIVTPRVSRSR